MGARDRGGGKGRGSASSLRLPKWRLAKCPRAKNEEECHNCQPDGPLPPPRSPRALSFLELGPRDSRPRAGWRGRHAREVTHTLGSPDWGCVGCFAGTPNGPGWTGELGGGALQAGWEEEGQVGTAGLHSKRTGDPPESCSRAVPSWMVTLALWPARDTACTSHRAGRAPAICSRESQVRRTLPGLHTGLL